MRSHSDFAAQIVGAMPQLVVGHRGSSNSHVNLRDIIKYTLKKGRHKSKLCYCGQCSTDYDITVDYNDVPQLLAEPSLHASAANYIPGDRFKCGLRGRSTYFCCSTHHPVLKERLPAPHYPIHGNGYIQPLGIQSTCTIRAYN